MDTTRWFDENGNEIIREKINPDELEYIAELGGQLEESIIGINFYSENLNKEEVTKLIKTQPTKAWNPNEMHKIGNGNKSRITKWGKWYLTTERDAKDINEKLNDLFTSMTNDLETWKYLTSKYEAWIDVTGYMENWNRGFTLKPETMKQLVDRNLEIVFDIYYSPDNED